MQADISEVLTRRRLGGAVLVLAGLVVAAIVLWPSDDSAGDRASAKRLPVRLVSVPELGLSFAHPRTWKRTVQRRVIRLRSPDGTALMTFATPVAGNEPMRVKDALQRELRKRFAPAEILNEGPARVGVRSATSFELQGKDAGKRIRALAIVDSTPFRTYAITLLTPAQPSLRRLAEVDKILATVSFSKPVRPKR